LFKFFEFGLRAFVDGVVSATGVVGVVGVGVVAAAAASIVASIILVT
jgi:hypothetical protein